MLHAHTHTRKLFVVCIFAVLGFELPPAGAAAASGCVRLEGFVSILEAMQAPRWGRNVDRSRFIMLLRKQQLRTGHTRAGARAASCAALTQALQPQQCEHDGCLAQVPHLLRVRAHTWCAVHCMSHARRPCAHGNMLSKGGRAARLMNQEPSS